MNLQEIKSNPQIAEFLKRSKKHLGLYHFTDHGIDHANLVCDRALDIATRIGLTAKEIELSSITAYVHDMGNFLNREDHEHWGALLFHNIYQNENIKDVTTIMEAIVNHDDCNAKMANKVAAVVILADKSDVRRSRVMEKDMNIIKEYIHNRVNYAVTKTTLKVKDDKIILKLEIDTKFVPLIEYFEIFTERMIQCRKAAEYLGYKFGLVINDFKLL